VNFPPDGTRIYPKPLPGITRLFLVMSQASIGLGRSVRISSYPRVPPFPGFDPGVGFPRVSTPLMAAKILHGPSAGAFLGRVTSCVWLGPLPKTRRTTTIFPSFAASKAFSGRPGSWEEPTARVVEFSSNLSLDSLPLVSDEDGLFFFQQPLAPGGRLGRFFPAPLPKNPHNRTPCPLNGCPPYSPFSLGSIVSFPARVEHFLKRFP